jgi:hypothetical protein
MTNFPFASKEQLSEIKRTKLIRLAGYYKIKVRRGWSNKKIVDEMWRKFHPSLIFCDGTRHVTEAEVELNDEGEEIVKFDGMTFNVSKMSVRQRLLMEARLRAKEE